MASEMSGQGDQRGQMEHQRFGTDPAGLYRDWLASRARYARRIAEVGVFAGSTTIRMARETRGLIWAVDHWLGVPADPVQQAIYRNLIGTRKTFHRRLGPWIDEGRVIVMEMGSSKAARLLMKRIGPRFDLIFIDADHRFRSVRRDIRAWLPLLCPDGMLAGHDIGWPGVNKAVAQCLPDFQHGPGSLWFWEKPQREKPGKTSL